MTDSHTRRIGSRGPVKTGPLGSVGLAQVIEIQRDLERADVPAWIAGGWAEQLRELIPPRRHQDIDLLYPATSFAAVDQRLQSRRFEEIAAKRFAHKRAFMYDGIMVELLLLQKRGDTYVPDFWNRLPLTWPADVLDEYQGVRVASVAALQQYRSWHDQIDEIRRTELAQD
jgi:hypothetical protein